jgi:hypothetical protein
MGDDKSIYMAAYFAFAACSKSGCREIQLDNAYKMVQSSSSSSSSTLI